MSWKSLVTAGIICVLASPVFAAPSITITSGGLNAQGNWVWTVQASNSNPVPTGGSPLAVELGFNLTSADLLSAVRLNQATNFDKLNPGNPIFPAWQTGANGLLDAASNNKPTGLQSQCPSGACTTESNTTPGGDSSVAGATSQLFAALGSVVYNTVGPHDMMTIVTKGPTANSPATPTASRKTVIQMLGVYGTGNVFGRMAELDAAGVNALNYDTYASTQFAVATPGDTNLVGGVDLTDFNTVLGNLGTGQYWQQGNFHANGTGTTDLTDFNTVLGNLGAASGGTGSGAGPGAGAGAAVPEPATLGLVALGFAGLLCGRRRK